MRVQQAVLGVALLAAALAGGAGRAAHAELLRMGGNGAVTAMLPEVFAAFTRGEENKLEVIPGLGHGGGMKAATDGLLDVAIASRPLNSQELAQGLTSVLAFRSPFGLVTSHPGADGFRSSEIADIFRSAKAHWADGSPIRIILRPRGITDSVVLAGLFPNMTAAIEQARRRPDVPTAANDQDNTQLAEQVAGSLAAAALTQVMLERRNLRFVRIDGVEPSLENLERGSYPYQRTMYFVLPAKRSAAAERFIAFLRSPEGKDALRASGNILVEN
jgi:phosphate transport system substrate-binding protein